MSKVLILIVLLTFGLNQVAPAFAESSSNKKTLGIDLTIHGEPSPSMLGTNIFWNTTSFMRLNLGVGGYSDWMGPNLAPGLYNHLLRPILWAASYILVYVITFVIYLPFDKNPETVNYDNFMNTLPPAGYRSRSVTSYGFGPDLLIPGISLSPFVGARYSHYKVSGGTLAGLSPGYFNQVYYTTGIDYTSNAGTHFKLGYNYCPKLKPEACGMFIAYGAAR